MALLSHFVFLGAILIPSIVLAISHGSPVVRVPDTTTPPNSQVMPLLEGYKNSNPTNIGGPVVAIIDNTALSAESEDATVFVEGGKSGTGAISTYVVKEGDTLGSIAQMFGVSANTIRWANDLSSNNLKVGEQLVILPISGVKHTVKKGDTLSSIAKLYNASQSDIIAYNDLPPDAALAVGDEIIIPDGELSSAPKASGSGSSSSGGSSSCGIKVSHYERLLVNPCNYPSYPGYYARPIAGGEKTQDLHGYNAVDLAAPVGTPIMAAADGTVILSKAGSWNGGYGTYVVVSHDNGTETLYGHMSEDMVQVGDHVSRGQVIGKVGMTGHTTGPHVHFEIRGARNPF